MSLLLRSPSTPRKWLENSATAPLPKPPRSKLAGPDPLLQWAGTQTGIEVDWSGWPSHMLPSPGSDVDPGITLRLWCWKSEGGGYQAVPNCGFSFLSSWLPDTLCRCTICTNCSIGPEAVANTHIGFSSSWFYCISQWFVYNKPTGQAPSFILFLVQCLPWLNVQLIKLQ